MDLVLNCPKCKKTLEDPILLPCGHSICQRHQTSKDLNGKPQTKLVCDICQLAFDIPKSSGFPANILVRTLLERNLNSLDLGPEHKAAQRSFREFKTMLASLKQMMKNPELEIDLIIGDLKNEIDLRREEAKKSIDDEALEIINELDEYEAKMRRGLTDSVVKETTQDMIKSLDDDLKTWESQLNSYEGSVKRWRNIHFDSVSKYKIISERYDQEKKWFFTKEFERLQSKAYTFCKLGTSGSLMSLQLNISPRLKDSRRFKSSCVVNMGVEWFLSVFLDSDCCDDDVDESVSVYLNAIPLSKTRDLHVDYELMIVNKISPSGNLTKRFTNHNYGSSGGNWGYASLIKLSEIKANKMFYDEELDIFTIKANIFDIKWYKT